MPKGHPTGRLVELDALRGLAASAVVLYHFTRSYGGELGWQGRTPPLFDVSAPQIGVAIFFIISGFVISLTLDRSPRPIDFALSRFARIYPAFWVACIISGLVIAVAGPNPQHLTVPAFVASLSMLNGITGLPLVDSSHWTLTRELLFYVLIATLFYGAGRKNLLGAALAWLVVSAIYNVTVADENYFAAITWQAAGALIFNTMFAYLFVLGIALYKLHQGERSPLLFITLVAAIVAGGVSEWPTRHGFAVSIVLKTFLYAAVVGIAAAGRLRVVRWPPLLFLGTISYSLYLIHQSIGFAIITRLLEAGLDGTEAVLITLAAVIALAAALWRWVEKPAQRMLRARHNSGGHSWPGAMASAR